MKPIVLLSSHGLFAMLIYTYYLLKFEVAWGWRLYWVATPLTGTEGRRALAPTYPSHYWLGGCVEGGQVRHLGRRLPLKW